MAKKITKANVAGKTKEEEVKEILEKMNPKIAVSERIGPAKGKRLSEEKYDRIPEDADIEKFKEMSGRVQNKSVEWAFYAIDGVRGDGEPRGYHYYRILTK